MPTFDGTAEQLRSCSDFTQTVSYCGDLTLLINGYGYGESDCYYDPSSGLLVGAFNYGDYAGFCDSTSYTQRAGQMPTIACSAPFIIKTPCDAQEDAASERDDVSERDAAVGKDAAGQDVASKSDAATEQDASKPDAADEPDAAAPHDATAD